MRSRLIATLVTLAATTVLAACGSGTDPYSSSGDTAGAGTGQASGAGEDGSGGAAVTVGLTYIPNVQFSPVYVAHDDGIYRAAGLDATIRHHGSDEALFTALASGEEDVVVASGDEVLQARDQGLDLVSIGAYYRDYPVVVIVPEDSPVQSLADLKGRKIGVPGEYGSSWLGLLAGLRSADMTSDDVQVVSIGYTQRAALTRGDVDAVVGFTNNDLVQFTQAGIPVRALPLSSGTVPLVSVSLITTHTWLDSHPQEARGVVQATTAGIQRVVDNPQHALEVTQRYDQTLTGSAAVEGARAVLAETSKLFVGPDGSVSAEQDIDRWTQMASFLASVPGILSGPADLGAAVTNDYTTP